MMEKLERLRIEGATVALSPFWSVFKLKGDDSLSFIHAQVTADLEKAPDLSARLCSRLTRAGRIHSFFYFLKGSKADDHYLLVPQECKERILSELNKFIIMEDVEILEASKDAYFSFGLSSMSIQGHQVLFYGLPGVIHFDSARPSRLLTLDQMEDYRILSGFPKWEIDCDDEMLVNESTLNELSVDYKKGCFLGQETAAKIQNNRGAATYPTLLKILDGSTESFHVGDELTQDQKKIAVVQGVCSFKDAGLMLVKLRREERVDGAQLEFTDPKGVKFNAKVLYLPYYKPTNNQEFSQELFELGGNAFRDGNEDKALNYLNAAIKINPMNEDAYESLGVLLGRLERFEEAIAMMDELSRVNPKSVMAHTNKSLYYMKMGKIEEAEKEKSEATFKSFQYFGDEAQKKKDEELQLQRKLEEQKSRELMFVQVLEIDEIDEIALYGLAQIRFDQNKLQESAQLLDRLLENHPKHTRSYLLRAKIHIESSQKDAAKLLLRNGINIAKKKGELMPANEMQALLSKL